MKEKNKNISSKSLKDLTDTLPLQPEMQSVISERVIKEFNDKLDSIQNALNEEKLTLLLKDQAKNLETITSLQKELANWLKVNTKKLYMWLVIILIINAILSCVLGTSSWIFFKTYYFKETPSQQKQIADMTFNGYHLRDMGDNKFLMNANDPNKKAYILDFNRDKIIHTPKLRVDKNGAKQL